MINQVHIDILQSINQFLNPVDRYFLRGVCQRLRLYFFVDQTEKPKRSNLIQYGYLKLLTGHQLFIRNKRPKRK